MIHKGVVSKSLIIVNILVLFIYLSWWFNPAHIGNVYLYALLLSGEIYHVIMALTFWHTLWPGKPVKFDASMIKDPSVDIFITVAGEPVSIVRETILAAKKMNYEKKKIYVLNDGFVAKKDNWKEIVQLARSENVECITRRISGGAKAGNINHALKKTTGEIVVIFDADMVAHRDFLDKVTPYFSDPKVGFVQTPQYYKNNNVNYVAAGAWEQQELFFGPIMTGKEKSNASFICGTNVAIRRKALEEVGGMNEKNIAEDFLTSLAIHQNGWKSYYISKVLVEGLAPEDLLSYFSQQLRWARGSLEVLFGANPLFKSSLSIGQKIEYLSSALYYFNGLVVLIDISIPIIFLFTGIQAVSATTTSFAIFFVPFMLFNLLSLYVASDGAFTFRAISFSQASWTLQLMALFSVLRRQKMSFSVTPKQAQTGNFLNLVYPHLLYIVLFVVSFAVAVVREGLNPSVVTNAAWGMFNVIVFIPFIYSAFNWELLFKKKYQIAVK